MPVERISEHCLQIRRFGFVNCYFVRESDGLTVVDTALGSARILAEAARQMKQPIRRIVLTHAHGDHTGSLDALKKIVNSAEVYASRREAQIIAEVNRGVKRKNLTRLAHEPQAPLRGSFSKVKTRIDCELEDGDNVGSLRVISTPGHTPGHIGFLDSRDGSFYAGDALTSIKELRLPFDPPRFFPLAKFATWHAATALTSARRLPELDIRCILTGHGKPVRNADIALKLALDRAEKVTAS